MAQLKELNQADGIDAIYDELQASGGVIVQDFLPPELLARLNADMDPLLALSKKHGVAVVEDAAHAHGSTWHGQPVGGLGHIGSFSL